MTHRYIIIDTKKPFDLTPKLRKLLAKSGNIAILWNADDVRNLRPDLTFEQSMEVLDQCVREHTSDIGINRDIIRIHADDLFPDPQILAKGICQ